ncbi:hypothetical protein Spla01_05533 [Streptomyces platensis]|uniref:Uncharacterized protein n=1 Tax=Streptomyces platensis TaxID=58346 RepID=A0ABX3XXQ2_STRPT|nr:hypothetical protein BG653_02872 [Streptomyces platensis]
MPVTPEQHQQRQDADSGNHHNRRHVREAQQGHNDSRASNKSDRGPDPQQLAVADWFERRQCGWRKQRTNMAGNVVLCDCDNQSCQLFQRLGLITSVQAGFSGAQSGHYLTSMPT